MRKHFLILLVLTVLLVGCMGSGGGDKPAETFKVIVSIYDDETKALIKEEVQLALGSTVEKTTSGVATFLNVRAGTKVLEVTADGYLASIEPITISKDMEHKVYLVNEDAILPAFVKSVRNAGMSVTNVWEPQWSRLQVHIEDKLAPFAEELTEQLFLLMAPLSNEELEFDLTRKEDRLVFEYTYTHEYPDDQVRVEYTMDMVDFENSKSGEQSLLNVSFSMYEGSVQIAKGEGHLDATITDLNVLEEWMEWVNGSAYYEDGYLLAPTKLFFSAASMDTHAWLVTPSFGRVDTASEISFDAETLKITANGDFTSSVMYMSGKIDVDLAEYDVTENWGFFLYPKVLKFVGNLGFDNIAEVDGALRVTFVPNAAAGILPSSAILNGRYRDLNSQNEEILANGSFSFNWTNASTSTGSFDEEVGLRAQFEGVVQEPGRPEIQLDVKATFDTLLEGKLEIEYKFGTHSLKGEGTLINQFDDYWKELTTESLTIELTNEHDLTISLTLNENMYDQKSKIGEIKDVAGPVLADLYLVDGVPHIYYPNGEFESLF